MSIKKRKSTKQHSPRWITTRAEYQWIDNEYVKTFEEGYWYEGPMALATDPPTLECNNWAFYSDGTESGSVIVGSVNTDPSQGDLAYDTTYFIRFDEEETAGNKALNRDVHLEYYHTQGTATWTAVNTTSSVIRTVASSNLTDEGNTTRRLGTSYTFVSPNGGVDNNDGFAGTADSDLQSNGMEWLFPFQIRSADVSAGDTIDLRLVDELDGLDVTPTAWPTITAAAAGAKTVDVDADVTAVTASVDALHIDRTFEAAVAAATEEVEALNYVRDLAENYYPLRFGNEDIGESPAIILTNNRFSKATVECQYGDSIRAPINKLCEYGEIRFPGARRTENFCLPDMTRWTSRASNVTCTAGISDPDGGNNAFTLTTSAGVQWFQDYTPGDNVQDNFYVRNSAWVRRRTGTGDIRMYNGNASWTLINPTGTWQRFSTPHTSADASINIGFLIITSGDEIDVYYPKFELVQGPQDDQTQPSETEYWVGANARELNPDPDLTLGGFWFETTSKAEAGFSIHQGPGYIDVTMTTAGAESDNIGFFNIPQTVFDLNRLIPDGTSLIVSCTLANVSVGSNVAGAYIVPVSKWAGVPYHGDRIFLNTFGAGDYIFQPMRADVYNSESAFWFKVYANFSAADTLSFRISNISIKLPNTNANGCMNTYYYGTENGNSVNGSYVVTEATGAKLEVPGAVHPTLQFGMLMEPQRTNIFSYSEDGTDASWTKTGVTAALTSDVAGIQETKLTSINTSTTAHEISKIYGNKTGATRLAVSAYIEPNGPFDYAYMMVQDTTTSDYVAVLFDSFNTLSVINTLTSGSSITVYSDSDFIYKTKWSTRGGFVAALTAATDTHNIKVSYGFTNSTTSVSVSDSSAPSILGWLGGMQCEQNDTLISCSSYIRTIATANTRNADLIRYHHGR